jgi:hypothetical protein
VRRLMRVMGIEALVPRPGTSKAVFLRGRPPFQVSFGSDAAQLSRL